VCSKHGKRKESIYWCSECEVGLCLDGCFRKTIQPTTSNSLASTAEIQDVHVIR
jgi:predicted RNA-binding protein with PUA domain